MRFTWSNAYSTGVQTIDLQHQALMAIVNDLHDCCARGAPPGELRPIMQRLAHYTVFHFRAEEALMGKAVLPIDWHTEHLAGHRAFTDAVQQYLDRLEDMTPEDAEKLQAYLVEWLKKHILEADKTLGKFLMQQALHSDAFDDRR